MYIELNIYVYVCVVLAKFDIVYAIAFNAILKKYYRRRRHHCRLDYVHQQNESHLHRSNQNHEICLHHRRRRRRENHT